MHVTVLSGASSFPYQLHTGPMQPIRHDDVTIELVQLDPYPFSGRPIEPADYRATLRVVR